MSTRTIRLLISDSEARAECLTALMVTFGLVAALLV